MKFLWSLMVLVIILLQTRLWFGDGSFVQVAQLQDAVEQQQIENQRLLERNRRLDEEVQDLKEGLSAIEERARMTMGMIGKDESFYMVVGTAR